MKKKFALISSSLLLIISLWAGTPQSRAAKPGETSFTAAQCEGSLTPYPEEVTAIVLPDSLKPVFINHVGRHGARYPASSANCLKLARALAMADSLGTITPLGRELKALNDFVIEESSGRWGALDSLGMAEQRAIASRMFRNFPSVFTDGCKVRSISSYSPRVMMSMYSFTHQLDRLDNKLEFTTSTGRVNSPLMRPFDVDQDYLDFRAQEQWQPVYDEFFEQTCPTAAIVRVLGKDYPFADANEWRDLAITEYYVLAGCSAMSIEAEIDKYFSRDELNRLWSCFNLRQYLQRTATTVSSVPADIASYLLLDIIETTDRFIEGKDGATGVCLRFGHAETLMPLLSLMRLDGCYYLTNYFDSVAENWQDFTVVPMAANLQIVVSRAKGSGHYYVTAYHNEKPISLLPGRPADQPQLWGLVRERLMQLIPIYAQ